MDRRIFLQGLGSVAVTGVLAEQASATIPAGTLVSDGPLSSKPVVKVCGIGSGGSNIVNHLMATGVDGVTEYVCIGADKGDLDRCTAHRKLLVGSGDFALTKSVESRRTKSAELQTLLDGANIVIAIAGLGGDDEAEIATRVVFIARKSGQQVASLLLMPFHQDIDKEFGARRGMVLPQVNSHVSMVISTEAIQASLGHQRTMAEYLAATDNSVLRALKAILAMTSGPGLLHAAPEDVSLASARIYAAELLREVERCAVETEVAIYEMKSAAGHLREEMSKHEGAARDHYLASDAFHSSQADLYAATARVGRIEFSGKGFESQARLTVMLTDREQMMRTLQERRKVLECAVDELRRLDNNCHAWKRNIEGTRESISWWAGDLKERLSELKGVTRLFGDDPEVPKAIDHATTVLARAENALEDTEITELVQSVEGNLTRTKKPPTLAV